MMSEQDHDILTPKEASEKLRCSLTTVYSMFQRGVLTGFRVGTGRGSIRIHAESVAEVTQKTNAPDQEPPAAPPPLPHVRVPQRRGRPPKRRKVEIRVTGHLKQRPSAAVVQPRTRAKTNGRGRPDPSLDLERAKLLAVQVQQPVHVIYNVERRFYQLLFEPKDTRSYRHVYTADEQGRLHSVEASDSVSPERFVEVWETSISVDEAAVRLGVPSAVVQTRASRYRTKGVRLKHM